MKVTDVSAAELKRSTEVFRKNVNNDHLRIIVDMLVNLMELRKTMFERETYYGSNRMRVQRQCTILSTEMRGMVPHDPYFMPGDIVVNAEEAYVGMITGNIKGSQTNIEELYSRQYSITAFSFEKISEILIRKEVTKDDLLGFASEEFVEVIGGLKEDKLIMYAEGNVINAERPMYRLPPTTLFEWTKLTRNKWGSAKGQTSDVAEVNICMLFRWIFLRSMIKGIDDKFQLTAACEDKEDSDPMDLV